MEKKRRCLFCGGPCNSREHVIPEWLSKTMQIREFAFQPAHFTEGKGLELRPAIKCAGFRTRQVCAECNNGWMSALEGWAKGKIGNAVAPGFALDSMSELALLDGETHLMVRWLLKTAIIFELASPRGSIQAVNPELFPMAAGKAPITDFHAWAGYMPNPNFLVHLTRGFPTWNGGKLAQYQIHSASVDFALQLNHLAIRLIRCPQATPGGPNARPIEAEWVFDIRRQCRTAGVAFFFKQWGGVNKKKSGRTLSGRIYNEMPKPRRLSSTFCRAA